MSHGAYLYPIWLRIWHLVNALLMLALIGTGISLHFASSSFALLRFEHAVTVHNVAGLGLALSYAYFLVGSLVSGNLRHYIPKRAALFGKLRSQVWFFCVGSLLGEGPPHVPSMESKFNVLQQVTYLLVMFLAMPLLIGSGILFLFPELAPEKVMGMSGLLPVAVLHCVIGYLLTLFLVGHIYLATFGASLAEHFRAISTGWHVSPPEREWALASSRATASKMRPNSAEEVADEGVGGATE